MTCEDIDYISTSITTEYLSVTITKQYAYSWNLHMNDDFDYGYMEKVAFNWDYEEVMFKIITTQPIVGGGLPIFFTFINTLLLVLRRKKYKKDDAYLSSLMGEICLCEIPFLLLFRHDFL